MNIIRFLTALLFFSYFSLAQESSINDYNSIFGVGYAIQGYAKVIKQTGAKWVKIPLVAWGQIEPHPPQNGKHFYNWKRLDKLIQEYEKAGFHIQIVIKAACPWGATNFAPPPERWRKSYPPKPKHLKDYQHFVYSLVERYDGDGYNDMPDLIYPIRHYEIESEAQHKIFWAGSVQDYEILLKAAYNAAKRAHPETKIILSGVNFGNFFDNISSFAEISVKFKSLAPKLKNEIFFIRSSIAMGNYYDIIDFHYNRDYTGAYWAVKWLRNEMQKYGYQKEIWAGDVASVPWVSEDTAKILTNPSHPLYNQINTWFRAEQAKLSVKKFIVAAALNIKKVFLESIKDFPKNAYKGAEKERWFLAGLLDENMKPRPVFYAYAQLTKKLKGFEKVTQLQAKNIYIFKIEFANRKPIWVVWSKHGPQQVTLNVNCPGVKIEKVITSNTKQPSISMVYSKNNRIKFSVDDTPVYVECIEQQ